MSFNTHNNNDQISNTTYSSYSFSNPEFMGGSKLSFTYFNRVLKITIAKKVASANSDYASYDKENPAYCYVSFAKAKILYDLIQQMKVDKNIHNVCVETNQGLLMVSDGVEYGSESPCISITKADNSGNIDTIVYQTKSNYHKGACNYDTGSGSYDDKYFDSFELEAFENILIQYYNAATYAVAASVMEANMYKRNAMASAVYAIAEKVGVKNNYNGGGNSGGGYSNKSSFLNNNNSNGSSSTNGNKGNSNGGMNGTPKGYETSSYDDIVNGMMG